VAESDRIAIIEGEPQLDVIRETAEWVAIVETLLEKGP